MNVALLSESKVARAGFCLKTQALAFFGIGREMVRTRLDRYDVLELP